MIIHSSRHCYQFQSARHWITSYVINTIYYKSFKSNCCLGDSNDSTVRRSEWIYYTKLKLSPDFIAVCNLCFPLFCFSLSLSPFLFPLSLCYSVSSRRSVFVTYPNQIDSFQKVYHLMVNLKKITTAKRRVDVTLETASLFFSGTWMNLFRKIERLKKFSFVELDLIIRGVGGGREERRKGELRTQLPFSSPSSPSLIVFLLGFFYSSAPSQTELQKKKKCDVLFLRFLHFHFSHSLKLIPFANFVAIRKKKTAEKEKGNEKKNFLFLFIFFRPFPRFTFRIEIYFLI